MFRRGFTLIELLVTISVMAIVGVTAMVSFSALMNKQDGSRLQALLETTIQKLDSYVSEWYISDYTLTFVPGKYGCIIEKNTYSKAQNKKLSLSFDFVTLSGTISRSSTDALMTELKSQNKTRKTLLSNDQTISFAIPKQSASSDSFSIVSYVDGDSTNIFDVLYYSAIGQLEKQDGIILTQINSVNQNGEISNFLGKKIIKVNNLEAKELNLIFEQQSKNFSVILK